MIVLGDFADGDQILADLSVQHRFVVGVSDRVERGAFPGLYAGSVGAGLRRRCCST
jgi:hypothetical protein